MGRGDVGLAAASGRVGVGDTERGPGEAGRREGSAFLALSPEDAVDCGAMERPGRAGGAGGASVAKEGEWRLDPFGGLALLRVDAGRPPVGVIDRVIDRVPDSGLLLMEVGLEREEPEASTGHHWGTFDSARSASRELPFGSG